MAQKISQWLGVLAVITLMMTLVPLGSAAPAEASISGTNVRDQNVLRTTGLSRVTYNGGPISDDETVTQVNRPTTEQNSIAVLQTTSGNQANWTQRAGDNSLPSSQIIRLRGSFFKNNTNTSLPTGGAPLITSAFFTVRDRNTGEWAIIEVDRNQGVGANAWFDPTAGGACAVGGACPLFNNRIMVFSRVGTTAQREFAFNGGAGVRGNTVNQNLSGTPADLGPSVTGDVDAPSLSTGVGNRPFISATEFACNNSVDTPSTGCWGVSGTASEVLNVSVQFQLATPEVQGPVDFYLSVQDAQNYADGLNYYASVTMGYVPTLLSAPFSGVSSTTATANNPIQIFASAEDQDTEADTRAVVATLIAPNGAYVQLFFYHRLGQNYGTPGTPGAGTSISTTDADDRYQTFDSTTGRYIPIKPTDTGTLTTALGVLDINNSSFATSGNRVTVTFRFIPNGSITGAYRVLVGAVDRELNSPAMISVGTFTQS